MQTRQEWTIEPSTFAEILPIWRDHLWPHRQSEIEPTSAINQNGDIDPSLLHSPVFFWAVQKNEIIVGVISAQVTGQTLRSRGIWVHPDFRKQGLGGLLMISVKEKAQDLKMTMLWSMPRANALSFYEKMGYVPIKMVSGFEFGPHYIAQATL